MPGTAALSSVKWRGDMVEPASEGAAPGPSASKPLPGCGVLDEPSVRPPDVRCLVSSGAHGAQYVSK